MNTPHIRTIKLRVKDRHAKELRRMADEVNFVWNYCNETSYRAIRRDRRWLSGFDLNNLTSGSTKFLKIGSSTIQEVGEEYAKKRRQFKKAKLRWRSSRGARRSLGWIPFKVGSSRPKNGGVFFNGKIYKVWDSYGISDMKFRSGCFSEDARGRWYFCAAVQVQKEQTTGQEAIGIDLGLKDIATTSNGEKLGAGRWYRDSQEKLAKAQRARKKKRVKNIHAKVKNQRKDALHKFSRKLVRENSLIVVGNVSASKLAKTKMAKSVHDAGWYMLKTMLQYKSQQAGAWFEEVSEAYSSQVCSSCGQKPPGRPKGIADLGIREWTCSLCGASHDRDVNAAKNILAAGHRRLAEGIPRL